MSCEGVICDITTYIPYVKLFVGLSFYIVKYFAQGVGQPTIQAALLLETWEKNLIELNEKVFVTILTRCHTCTQLHVHMLF